jgi:hypothetical protein
MANVYINAGTAEEQPIERVWDKKTGFSLVRRWRGTEAVITSLYDSLISGSAYSNVSMTEGAVWEVRARADTDVDGNNDPAPDNSAVDTWELTANRADSDILSSSIASVTGLNEADLLLLRDFVDGKKAFDDYISSSPAFVAPASGDPVGIYDLLKRGTKRIVSYAPVIRKTQTVANNYAIPSALTNVSKVWTTASFLAVESVPPSIGNNLPASSVVGDFQYGWLKGFPAITDTVDGKVQLQQEWEWGLWSTVLYNVV